MAGFIYKQLGMRFLTPTIDLYLTPDDFIELLRHLHDYMESKLVEDKQSDKDYPVGILERNSHTIKVYFQHYDNFKIAYEKWERRKSRINYNNIYVVADDDWRRSYSDKNINDFKQLPYQHKIIITGSSYRNNKMIFSIPNCNINGHLGNWWEQTNNVRHSQLFEEWNYVDFLNQQSLFIVKIIRKIRCKKRYQ